MQKMWFENKHEILNKETHRFSSAMIVIKSWRNIFDTIDIWSYIFNERNKCENNSMRKSFESAYKASKCTL